MILKLSEVLSYSLYECEAELVDIETELAAVWDFILLEKLKHSGCREVFLDVSHLRKKVKVPPMLILSFLQETATILKEPTKKQQQIVLSFSSAENDLSINITIKAPDAIPQLNVPIINMRNRMEASFQCGEFSFDAVYLKNECIITIHINNCTLSVHETEQAHILT
jgi:LytS/YehU family sensor histidine kinase